jgi:hypothetical protein
MARTVQHTELSNELKEYGPDNDLGSLLAQIREAYEKYKIEEHMAKAKAKAKWKLYVLFGSAVLFFVLTGLIIILQFKGLLKV